MNKPFLGISIILGVSVILAGCFGPTTPQQEFTANRSEFVQAEFELLSAGCKYDRKESRIACAQTSADHAQRLATLTDEYLRTGEKLLAFDRSNKQAFLTRVERFVVEKKLGNAKQMRNSFSGVARL